MAFTTVAVEYVSAEASGEESLKQVFGGGVLCHFNVYVYLV